MRRLLVLACCLGAAGWLAAVASACHSEITATLDCGGKVAYTATAWTGSGATTAARTNGNVAVWVTANGQTQTASGHFGSDDNFSFSGTFSVGGATSATVYVQEKANWGSGDAPAPARSVTVTRPGNCSSGGGGTTPPSPPAPPVTPPVQPAPPVAPAPPASISVVKLERVGSTGDYVSGPVTAKVGDTVDYEIVVTNTGPAVSFSVSDPGCTGLAPAGTEALETGKSMTFVCSHTIVTADGSTYTNTVVATATAASGIPVTASASAVANVAASGVLGTTTTVAPTHKQVPAHKKTQKKVKQVKKVKKVTKRAAPARARVRSAGFTG